LTYDEGVRLDEDEDAMEEAVLLYPERDGIYRAKVPVVRGLVIESPDRDLVQHLAACAIARARPGSVPVFIDVSPEAAVEPNPLLDTIGIFADDPTWDDFIAELKAIRAQENARTFDDE
jgi:hypothetical protein